MIRSFRKSASVGSTALFVGNETVSSQKVAFVKDLLSSFGYNADSNGVYLSMAHSPCNLLFSEPLLGFFGPFNQCMYLM